MNFARELSKRLVKIIDQPKGYSQEKEVIMIYGMELILNSTIKLIVYLIIGAAIEKFKEVVFVILIFGIVRKSAGGIHAKTGAGCFFLTGIVIAASVFSPQVLRENRAILSTIPWIINFLYFIFAPYDEYFEQEEKENYYKTKWQVMILINIFLLFLTYMSLYWRTIGMTAMLIEGMTLIRKRK